MEYDKKAAWQRYSELTTADLIELQRSNRLPAAEASMVDEMLEFRGVSKTTRDNLRNLSTTTPFTPTGPTSIGSETSYKDIAPRPVLVTLIAVFAVWGSVINLYSMFEAKTPLSFLYFMVLAILGGCLAYGLVALKPWARNFVIFVSGLHIFLAWFWILLLFMLPDDHWKLSIAELSRSTGKMSGEQFFGAVVHKIIFIKACIWTVVYGLLIIYFFRPSIRRLFL